MSTWSSPSGLLTRAVKELPSVSLVTRSTWANTLMIIVTLSTLEKLLKMIIVMVAIVVGQWPVPGPPPVHCLVMMIKVHYFLEVVVIVFVAAERTF